MSTEQQDCIEETNIVCKLAMSHCTKHSCFFLHDDDEAK